MAAVVAEWRALPDRQWRALVYIAHRTRDEPAPGHPARLYYAGAKDLALNGLGLPRQSLELPTASHLAMARRTLKQLVDAGALQKVSTGHRGHNAEYRLVLSTPVDKPAPTAAGPSESVTPQFAMRNSTVTHQVTPRLHTA